MGHRSARLTARITGRLHGRMTGRDHYEVLGVARSASARDIRRAYRALALRYHPDVYSGADGGSRFREIRDAYEVLHDAPRRARYDAKLRSPAPGIDEDSAAAWEIRRRSPDVPRFVDDDTEPRPAADDLIRALLREMLPTRSAMRISVWGRSGAYWPSGPFWTREVWRWR